MTYRELSKKIREAKRVLNQAKKDFIRNKTITKEKFLEYIVDVISRLEEIRVIVKNQEITKRAKKEGEEEVIEVE